MRPGNTCCPTLCAPRLLGQSVGVEAMLYNIHHRVVISIRSYQTRLLVLNHFNLMYQTKKFGAEILFIPYFSPLGPPSHSPCFLVSVIIVAFLLETPAWDESSSSWAPSGYLYKSAFHRLFLYRKGLISQGTMYATSINSRDKIKLTIFDC